jgi:hypothetical protein
MKKIIIIFIIFLSITFTQEKLPPVNLISIPTAGTVEKGAWNLDIHLQKNGGVLSSLLIGMTPNFSLGLSYGVQNLIGNSIPTLNRTVPEVQVKYRILEESELYPAFVIGLTTQGFGGFDSTYSSVEDDLINKNRYEFKAHGFYGILSKNWNLFGNLGLHIGGSINTWEGSEDEKIPNFLLGLDKDINNSFTFLAEYNFATNDKNNTSFKNNDKWPGFLNAGIRWSISESLQAELCLIQIRKTQKFNEMNREFKILYQQSF